LMGVNFLLTHDRPVANLPDGPRWRGDPIPGLSELSRQRWACKSGISASFTTPPTLDCIRLPLSNRDIGRAAPHVEPGASMSIHILAIAQSLAVISAANSAPLLCKRLLGVRFARAIDGGLILWDGYPLLGSSKTWRGLIAAMVLSTCASALVGLQWQNGALAGACAMTGDCLSSLIKRRLGLGASDKSLGLDQVPESLLPAVACALYLPLGSFDVAAIVLLFFVGQVLLSRLSFEIGLRDQPY
ncbi:MAG TPA: hypothetical protein VED02_03795, partial [Methyloceanibacter sp.]|nr:hypothetical protein [Methyloceanibacter sp.]